MLTKNLEKLITLYIDLDSINYEIFQMIALFLFLYKNEL